MLTFPTTIEPDLVRRVQMEFMEMPGLRLTSQQACRLWNLDAHTCDRILAILSDEQFLARTRDGAYLRRATGRLDRHDAA